MAVTLTDEEVSFLIEELTDHGKKFIGLTPHSETVAARAKGLRLILNHLKEEAK